MAKRKTVRRSAGRGKATSETLITIGKTMTLPVVPLREMVLFPYTMVSLTLDDPASIELVEDVLAGDRLAVFAPLTPGNDDDDDIYADAAAADADAACDAAEAAEAAEAAAARQSAEREVAFFEFGCTGRIIKMLRFPDDSMRVLVRGISRVRLNTLVQLQPYRTVTVTELLAANDPELATEALVRNCIAQFQDIITLSPQLPEELRIAMMNIDDASRLADMIADTLNLDFREKLEILAQVPLRQRFEAIAPYLHRENLILQIGGQIQDQVHSVFAKHQREHFLREQLRAIQEQLGEDNESPDIADMRRRIEQANLSEEAQEAAMRELQRIQHMPPSAADYNISRTYIEWLTDLPWGIFSEDSIDLGHARDILAADHYDLEKVKDRILEYLAVLKLNPAKKGPILCFTGPPGVGKTSLGRSIARALGREFIRISLGGVHDEAAIRGHRRTYVGALPGRIIQGIRKAGTANPVFMLDEIDKVGRDFRGDPASALLEALDPEQNASFADHYIEVPFDLSRVIFITTANLAEPIPPALLDRMEVIRLPGYTQLEKRRIAERYLLPRQLKENGVKRRQLRFQTSALEKIIQCYTCEAGVRNLEREIGNIVRKHGRQIVEGTVAADATGVINSSNLSDYLGPQRIFPESVMTHHEIGAVTGLAWTAAGGEILHIEVAAVPGNGKLMLTGSLGDVMKESAQIALSYVRSQASAMHIDADFFAKHDLHVHVPAGATPKDGPSAGITLATAIASLAGRLPVKPRLGMTGELSLRGNIMPVGGIKEKVLAAARAGIKTLILPEKNRADLEDVPEEIRRRLTFVFASDARAAFKLALEPRSERGKTKLPPRTTPTPKDIDHGSSR